MYSDSTDNVSLKDTAMARHGHDNNKPQLPDTEKASNAPPPDSKIVPAPPPDGGLLAWLQVASGFAMFFNTWGMISAFSVFQTYYESGELFTATSSEISWIGSIQSFLMQVMGLIAGPIYDRGYLRHLILTGSFLVVFGLMMLSLCTEYWQALLAQGFCIGIGAGLLFVPTVSLLPTWFRARMGLAMGISSSGSSLGGVIYPVVLSRLIPQIGFPWAVRSVGFIALATFMVPLAAMRIRVRPPKPRAVVDWSAFRDAPFMVLTVAVLVLFIGQGVLLFYISFYPADKGLTNTTLAFYVAAIFNAGSVLGRILPNALSDRIGVFNTVAPLTVLLGATMLCLLAVHNAAGMIVEAVVTGFFSGTAIALAPICFRILTPNPSLIGTRMGQGFALAGAGTLLSGPSAGAILGAVDPLDWTGLWAYGGVAAVVSGFMLFGVRVMKAGFKPKVKV